MTKRSDLKQLVRSRMEKTGESYVTALRHIRSGSGGGGDDAPPAALPPIQISQLFSYFPPKGHSYVVPKSTKEFGPYPDVRRVPDDQLEAVTATESWRALTDAEVHEAMDAQFEWPAFEDYSSEQDWDF